MHTATVNEAYSIYNELQIEDKEFLLDLIKKQIVEARREAILAKAKAAESNYLNGKAFHGNVDEVMEFLDNDWNICWWKF